MPDVSSEPRISPLYAILNLPYPFALELSVVVDAMIAGGVGTIQLRCKTWSAEKRLAAALPIATRCRAAGCSFVVNDDLESALAAKADFLHLGQGDLAQAPELVDKALAAGLKLGLSTHSDEEFLAAQAGPWSYVALGPLFATQSKENPEPTVGVEVLERCLAQARKVTVGIGGINAQRAEQLWCRGIDSVAVISALQGASAAEIEARCRAFERPASLG